MAKKKQLLTYREWQQKEAARKAKAAATRAAAKEAKMAAWWAIPAERNYVELDAGWVESNTTGPVLCRNSDTIHHPGDMMIHAKVLPDKRRLGRSLSKVSIHLTVEAGTTKEEVTERLLALATAVFASDNLWDTVNGPALERPMRFEGHPQNLRRQEPSPAAPATQTQAPTSQAPDIDPSTAMGGHPLGHLVDLRSQLQQWLSAHRTDDSPLALLTVEQLAEVLLMRVCGDDIALVSERDPWRWDHTAEEIRAAEERLADEVQTLSGLVTDLNGRLGPEAAIEVLLTVFVQGQVG